MSLIKADLEGLFDKNKINISSNTHPTSIVNAANSLDGVGTTYMRIDNNEDSVNAIYTINGELPESSSPIYSVQKCILTVAVALRGTITFNKGFPDETTVNWDTGRTNYDATRISVEITGFSIENLYNWRIYVASSNFYTPVSDSINDLRIHEIELFVGESPKLKSKSIEFDDALLETKSWNSSRYSGRQLQGSKINEFNEGDNSYAGTPVVQNYSRNIYLGSRVIGMESGSIEDASLLNLPGFSYVTVHEYITVNDDLSVTKHTIRGDIGERVTKKKGFYQSWYKDFPNQSKIEIKTLDRKLQQSLRPNYTIFNNSGQLQKLLLVHKAPDPAGFHHVALYNRDTEPPTDPEDNAFSFATGSYLTLGSNFFFFNKSLLVDEFFTGSLIAEDVIGTTVANQGSNPEATETSDFGG